MTPLQMYGLLFLDKLHSFFIGGLVLSGIGLFMAVGWIASMTDVPFSQQSSEVFKVDLLAAKRRLIFAFLGFLVSAICLVTVPTTKEMAVIVSVPKIVNNEKVKALPDKVLVLAEEWLNELKPKAGK